MFVVENCRSEGRRIQHSLSANMCTKSFFTFVQASQASSRKRSHVSQRCKELCSMHECRLRIFSNAHITVELISSDCLCLLINPVVFVRDSSDWPLPSNREVLSIRLTQWVLAQKTIFALAFGANRAAASTTISQRNADKGIIYSSTF